MTPRWQHHNFAGVGIFWHLGAEADSFGVRATWRGEEFLTASLSAGHPDQAFRLDDDEGQLITAGSFHSIWTGDAPALDLDLQYPGGEVTRYPLFPAGPPPPPPPPPPKPEESLTVVADLVSAAPPEDLFPYLYIRPWPTPTPAQRTDRFVEFSPPDCAAEPSHFVCQLAAEKTAGDRTAAENLAVAFLEGTPPWAGLFVRSVANLPGPIAHFGRVDLELRTRDSVSLAELKGALELATGLEWAALAAYVTEPSSSFSTELDRVWSSLFALAITLGYDTRDLDALIATVVLAALVVRVAVDDDPARWPASRVTAGLSATVVLPESVFPLPPGAGAPTAPGWQIAYAAGDLKMVQRWLVGYGLGEISAIENVLQGEQKETTQRRLTRHAESIEGLAEEDSRREDTQAGAATDLLVAAQETLAAQFQATYQTTYGPPTEATASGNLTLNGNGGQQPLADRAQQAARFARDIAGRSVRSLASRVLTRRSRSLLQEDEGTVVHRFDARNRDTPIRGVYRWVNKIYGLQVVQRGHRLLLELEVPQPAAAFVRAQWVLAGVDRTRPRSPVKAGVHRATDIATDPKSPLYWATLAAEYGALEVAPPPTATVTASVSIEGSGAPAGSFLGLPDGYQATSGVVTAGWPSGRASTAAVTGVLGAVPFQLTPAAPSQASLALGGETGAVPLAVTAAPAPDAGGLPATPPEPPWVLTAVVSAELSSHGLEAWQVATYRALVTAYERRKAAFYEAAGPSVHGVERHDPRRFRDVEQREIRRDVTRQLLAAARSRVGDGPPVGAEPEPSVWVAGEPRYDQFLDDSFEWAEMTYSFRVPTVAPRSADPVVEAFAAADALFTAFLEAGSARVLLPVRPGRELTVLYCLAAGMIWPGLPALTPSLQSSVSIVNELKALALEPVASNAPGERWEVVVPTAMTWLEDGAELPRPAR